MHLAWNVVYQLDFSWFSCKAYILLSLENTALQDPHYPTVDQLAKVLYKYQSDLETRYLQTRAYDRMTAFRLVHETPIYWACRIPIEEVQIVDRAPR